MEIRIMPLPIGSLFDQLDGPLIVNRDVYFLKGSEGKQTLQVPRIRQQTPINYSSMYI